MNRYFYNLPRRLTVADYENCCRRAVERIRKEDGVVAIYLMGGKWVPGVSDLDLVIVYETRPGPNHLSSPSVVMEIDKFIMTHRPLKFSQEDFNFFYYLYPPKTANLRLLWGRELDREFPEKTLSRKEHQVLVRLVLFDLLVNKLLLFPRYLQMDKVNVRQVVGELHSLIYTFNIMDQISTISAKEKQARENFSDRIKDLRYQWFNRGRKDNFSMVMSLLKESVDIVNGITVFLSRDLERQGFMADSYDGWFINQDYLVHFSGKTASYQGKSLLTRSFRLSLPGNLLSIIRAYSRGNGLFSRQVSKSLVLKRDDKIFWSEGVEKHLLVLNNVFATSWRHNGYYKAPFPYGFPIPGNWLTDLKRLVNRVI